MINVYEEYCFSIKPTIIEIIFRNVLFILGLLFTYYSFYLFLLIPIAMLLFMMAYYYQRSLKREYEYILINDELKVDRIIAKSSRKQIETYDLNNLKYLSYNNPEFHQKYANMKYKRKRYTSKKNTDKEYALMFKQGNIYSCIIIQADQRFLTGIKSRHLLQMDG